MDDAGVFAIEIERLREHAAAFRKLADEHAEVENDVMARKLREVAAELEAKAEELERLQAPARTRPLVH